MRRDRNAWKEKRITRARSAYKISDDFLVNTGISGSSCSITIPSRLHCWWNTEETRLVQSSSDRWRQRTCIAKLHRGYFFHATRDEDNGARNLLRSQLTRRFLKILWIETNIRVYIFRGWQFSKWNQQPSVSGNLIKMRVILLFRSLLKITISRSFESFRGGN